MMAQLRSFSLLSPSRSSFMGVTRKHECRSLENMMPSLIVLHSCYDAVSAIPRVDTVGRAILALHLYMLSHLG